MKTTFTGVSTGLRNHPNSWHSLAGHPNSKAQFEEQVVPQMLPERVVFAKAKAENPPNKRKAIDINT